VKHVIVRTFPDDELAARWRTFLARAPFATHYLTPNYFTDPYVYGERFALLAIDDSDAIAAAMTGTINGDRIVSGMFSRPQLAFCEGANKDAACEALYEGLNTLGAASKLTEVYSWEPVGFRSLGMKMRASGGDTSVVLLDLAKGADALFAEFSQTRRNEIRKAERLGLLEIKELKTAKEIDEIYRIHCDWNARKGRTPDTISQMQAAIANRENRRVFIAKVDGKTIAGSFYRFSKGGVVEYAANFSLPEYQRLRPNDLVGWHAIKWACENRFRYFSMGGSHLFLRRFGGDVVTTYRYRRDSSTLKLHDLRENARAFGLGVYHRLPKGVRAGMKRILAK
jgi:hypothetical protein